jgi:hypothetical protein
VTRIGVEFMYLCVYILPMIEFFKPRPRARRRYVYEFTTGFH